MVLDPGESPQQPMTKHKPHSKFDPNSRPAAPDPVAPDPTAPGDASEDVEAAGGAALIEPPEQTIQRLSEELEASKDRNLRLAAEFDNFKKRTQRERAETWSRAQAAVVSNILDALDDLGRVTALDAERTAARDVLAGLQLAERKLLRELTSAGLERVGAEGEAFDPKSHEAVSTMPASSPEQDHLVATVMQPGYRFGGALLRPARVSVYVWQDPGSGGDGRQGA